MGSYLSIKNNTEDTWTCKIGPDEAALKIAGIVITVISAAATVIGTLGAAAPVASALSANGVVQVFGVSTRALSAVAKTADSIASAVKITGKVSDFGNSVAKGVNDNLISEGYVNIAPGESHKWGKMSLSLWQQGTCVRTTIVDETTVTTDTVYMRPIFSGATDNSNIDHEIQYWINKFGLETSTVQGTSDEQTRKHRKGAVDEDDSEDDEETIYFYSNGTVGYGDELMAAHKWKQH
ncbi:hypothetical protein PHYBOEH_009638 [Phytophthora boehmeriae]|uniref:Uncharacterized protein n=1 Tax=Phytophthora boehmeriae TaxID=109152 RepID=A0A8T1VX72_9STRA|nr:hypothetical protein PHYBOEH_009638 [Phytophthora boehmeriae]